jgi:hypothetical protein
MPRTVSVFNRVGQGGISNTSAVSSKTTPNLSRAASCFLICDRDHDTRAEPLLTLRSRLFFG